MKRPHRLWWIASVGLVLVSSACATPAASPALDHLDALAPTTTTTTPDATPTTQSSTEAECERRTEAAHTGGAGWDISSLRPPAEMPAPGTMPPGSFMEALYDRGFIRVGVDENTAGLSARDPRTGRIEGFEVALAYEIAERIFGEASERHVDPVPVVTEDKREVVVDGTVDLTISAVTMSCGRWEEVSFSTEYYTAVQELLMRTDQAICGADDACDAAELDGATVCVTTRSSSLGILEDFVPGAEIVAEPDRTGCLVRLQEGDVDAYFGHNTFQYGMLEQDPTLTIRPLVLDHPDETVSHYGIAISHEHDDFVRFVNGVLEDLRRAEPGEGSRWTELYQQYLAGPYGLDDVPPPRAEYRD